MDEAIGLGNSKYWLLPDTHPFHYCGVWHDLHYALRGAGLYSAESSLDADIEFYHRCLRVVSLNPDARWMGVKLKYQAELFFDIVRAWGKHEWPEPTCDSELKKKYIQAAIKMLGILREANQTVGWNQDNINESVLLQALEEC